MSVSPRQISGFIIAIALTVIPLAHGGTRSEGRWLLVGLIGSAGLCWISELIRQRHFPAVTPLLLGGLGTLVLAAVPWLGHFTQPTSLAEFTNGHYARVAARWPNNVVSNDAAASLALHASLGLVLWMVANLSRNRPWNIVFPVVMIATAVVTTLAALMQTHLHLPVFFRANETTTPGFYWGPFFHHTSAGAYLNTTWPLAAGLIVVSRYLLPAGRVRVIASLVALTALILLLGAHASHISRFPQIAALVVMPLLFFKLKPFAMHSTQLGIAAVIAGVFLIAAWLGRTGEIAERWQLLSFPTAERVQTAPPENQWPKLVRADLLIPNRYGSGIFGDRGEAQRTAWRAVVARPLTGHGPGNWLGAASRYCVDPYVRTFYLYLQFVHEDFLQAWVERGLPGFLSLLILLGGGLLVILRQLSTPLDVGQNLLPFAAALGLAAVLLQSLIDFPLQIPAVTLNAHVLAGICWGRLAQPSTPITPT